MQIYKNSNSAIQYHKKGEQDYKKNPIWKDPSEQGKSGPLSFLKSGGEKKKKTFTVSNYNSADCNLLHNMLLSSLLGKYSTITAVRNFTTEGGLRASTTQLSAGCWGNGPSSPHVERG